jgi:hypothetical protein
VRPQLPDEAAGFGESAAKAFAAHGGVDLARRAEADPDVRTAEVAALLRSLGAEELDPRDDLDTAAAAGELCRMAGRVALPYPVAATLLRRGDGRPSAPAALTGTVATVDHGDLFPDWTIVSLTGASRSASAEGNRLGSRLGPFVSHLRPADERPEAPGDAAMWLVLTAWKVLGCVERALQLAVSHVRDRSQFGQKLSEFQAVQFQLADAAVALAGLDELCRYTLWRTWADPQRAATDALALRLCSLDTARTVLRTAQQLHGAAGVCDEYDVSILARHIQPDLRLPFGASSTAEHLAAAVDRDGFEALFPQGGRRP